MEEKLHYPLVDEMEILPYTSGMDRKKAIAVFAGSSPGSVDAYGKAAAALGREMASRGITLVYGGGSRGLMGITAEAVKSNGGKVIGVLPEFFNSEKVREKEVETELHIVPDMHERKKLMYSLADGFIALPGGIGTMEELCEIYTWRQLKLHNSNIGVLNIRGYWDPFIAMLDRSMKEGFLSEEARSVLIAEEDPAVLIDRIFSQSFSLPDKL